MKKSNKRKVAALALCGALLAGITLSPASASAEEQSKTAKGRLQAQQGSLYTATVNNDSGAIEDISIPIKASTAGSEIEYKVTVEYGAMVFKYSYGRTWDTANHKYTGGVAGWDPTCINGENNHLTITNHSNFPLKTTVTTDDTAIAAAFNQESGSVRGCLSEDNDTLLNNISKLNDGSISVGGTQIFTLEMDKSKLSTGDIHYKKGNDPNFKKLYFAFCGTPDKNLDPDTNAGAIKISLVPAEGVTAVTI